MTSVLGEICTEAQVTQFTEITKTLGTEFTFKIGGCVTHVRQENSVRAVN